MDGYDSRLYLVVEHRNQTIVDALRARLAKAQEQINALREANKRLERRFGEEVYINGILTDLLREHGIPFRDNLDYSIRKLKNPEYYK